MHLHHLLIALIASYLPLTSAQITTPTIATATTLARGIQTLVPILVKDSAFDATSNTFVFAGDANPALVTNNNAYLYFLAGDTGASRTPQSLVLANNTVNRVGAVVATNGTAVVLFGSRGVGDPGSDCVLAGFNLTTVMPMWTLPIPRFAANTTTVPGLLTTDASLNIYATVTIGIPSPDGSVASATRLLKVSPNGTLLWSQDIGNPPTAPAATSVATTISIEEQSGRIALAGDFGLAYAFRGGGRPSIAYTLMPDGRKPLAAAYSTSGIYLYVSTAATTYTLLAVGNRIEGINTRVGGDMVMQDPTTRAPRAIVVSTVTEGLALTPEKWNVRVAAVSMNSTSWRRELDFGSMDVAVKVGTTADAVYVTADLGLPRRGALIKLNANNGGLTQWIARTPTTSGVAPSAMTDKGIWLTSTNGYSELLAF
ncbi:hypothetical protein HDU96_004623 [Phlyctochytrium bullatum]|nr:hypothetical protein HDU96_004623 [Phlyctochytrium bullatum]